MCLLYAVQWIGLSREVVAEGEVSDGVGDVEVESVAQREAGEEREEL